LSDLTSLLNLVIGSGIVGSILSLIQRHNDLQNKKKSILYYPLFLACSSIIKVVDEHEVLGKDYCRKQVISSSKTLDQIIFNHGSLIYLKKTDLGELLKMKAAIDRNIESFEKDTSWDDLKKLLEDHEFQNIKRAATHLYNESIDKEKGLLDIRV